MGIIGRNGEEGVKKKEGGGKDGIKKKEEGEGRG